jgi:hypothetical protein
MDLINSWQMQESQLPYINQHIETGNCHKFLKTNWLNLENLNEWRTKDKKPRRKRNTKEGERKEEKRQGKPQTTPPEN